MSSPATKPAADPAEVARFSALAAQWWNARGDFAPLHRLNPVRLAFIRERCLARFGRDPTVRRPFAGLRLADVGCGGGLVTEPMARLGFAVTAVDPSPQAVQVARAHALETGLLIDYRDGGLEALGSESGAFDVVLALEVIEHAPDAPAFVADCAALLAPGGVIVIASLNRTLKSLALGKVAAEYLLRWVPPGTHDWRKFPTPAEVGATLQSAGLEVEPPVGVSYRPLAADWVLSTDAAVNFMIAAGRPSDPAVQRRRSVGEPGRSKRGGSS